MNAIAVPWSNFNKVLFRFLFIYLILYSLPIITLWTVPVNWVGEHILHLDRLLNFRSTGSGDTTFHYVYLLLIALIAAVGALLWSVLDIKRSDYNKLFFWFTAFLRYKVSYTLLVYGMAKVIKTQFPFPFFDRLTQPVGDLSPMGLLWAFMGYSTAYNIFTGLGEVIGSVLLLFRRTALFGSIILAVILVNVVMLNFSYDVPVKLASSHLLFMCLLLLAPYTNKLWRFFVLHEAIEAEPLQPVFKTRWLETGLMIVGVLFFLVITTQLTINMVRMKAQEAELTPGHNQVFTVEVFKFKGDTIPPGTQNTVRWKKVTVVRSNYVNIEYMDGGVISMPFVMDSVKHQLTLNGAGYTYQFQCSATGPDNYYWKGYMVGGDSVAMKVKREERSFLLVNREFHWINEHPYNR